MASGVRGPAHQPARLPTRGMFARRESLGEIFPATQKKRRSQWNPRKVQQALLGFRWSSLPFQSSLAQLTAVLLVYPRDRQVPFLGSRDVSSQGSSSISQPSGSRTLIPTGLPVLVCFACRSIGILYSQLHFTCPEWRKMNGAPAKASQHVQVTTTESIIKVANSKKSEPWTKCSSFIPRQVLSLSSPAANC